MAYVVDIQFFNTFILRSASKNTVHVEESRIKGGFNEPFAALGPKAYATNENYEENRRENALIYSGIYNSRTDINQTNVFSGAEKITRAVDPANGSIQKLYAEDTNLNILQENKVSYALIDKDAIFTAEGGQLTASGAQVIGQIVPYLGKYGISKNPESFAIKGNRKYFSDKNRGAILRLSRDGITEISSAGMKDWFKDNLKTATSVVGMYDDNNDEYVVSLKTSSDYNTLAFDERVKGWTSFYKFNPDFGFTVNKNFITINSGDLWLHNKEYSITTPKNTFYGTTAESSITFVANTQPSVEKTFHTINYEGDAGWEMKSSTTDLGMTAKPVLPSSTAVASGVIPVSFVKKENKYYSHLRNNTTTTASNQVVGVETSGIKGFFTTVKMQHNSIDKDVELFSVSHNVAGKLKVPRTTTKK
jgi:hypothetical protein|tara:strand:+ start:243 stop:1499 length:1257 start_codon:yes stop_codon:yes gene_type:complete